MESRSYNITLKTGAIYHITFDTHEQYDEFEDWLVNFIKPDIVQWKPGFWINKKYIASVVVCNEEW